MAKLIQFRRTHVLFLKLTRKYKKLKTRNEFNTHVGLVPAVFMRTQLFG